MSKNINTIGITCDNYKRDFFRKGLRKEKLEITYDGSSSIAGVHIFKIEVEESQFVSMQERLRKIITRLDIEFKQSN